jgi:hypothetical protein
VGNITINSNITGGGGGGGNSVSGASNLTTAGAIPYVSAPGTLNQDATALFWDASNDRLGVGTNTPATRLHVSGDITQSGSSRIINNAQDGYFDTSGSSYGISIRVNSSNSTGIRLAPTTGNLLIGTTTDSNFKLDVATSGSAGTARFYDQTATTGSTKVVIRAGAGQSGANLMEWQVANGTTMARFRDNGVNFSLEADNSAIRNLFVGSDRKGLFIPPAAGTGAHLKLDNLGFVSWTPDAGVLSADLSLSRASAGVLQVGDGGSNANGQVSATRVLHAGVLVAALPAAAAGNAGSIQYVTDANATTIGSTVAGGGANKVMVWSDGAAWKIFAS